MSSIDIERLNSLGETLGYQIKTFNENRTISALYKLCEASLNFFIEFAKVIQFSLETVVLEKKALESANLQALSESLIKQSIDIRGVGKVEYKGTTKGTVIFVDITRSSKYFEEKENYTGFVIFNAFILVVKKITEAFGGEFLEHTGDGAFIFFPNEDPNEDWSSSQYSDVAPTYIWVPAMEDFYIKIKDSLWYKCSSNPESCNKKISNLLSAFLLAGEFFKYLSSKEGLIRYVGNNTDTIPSLIHIGSSYGKVHEFNIGKFKKLVSKTVWDAANNCKEALREYKIRWFSNDGGFYVLDFPLKYKN